MLGFDLLPATKAAANKGIPVKAKMIVGLSRFMLS